MAIAVALAALAGCGGSSTLSKADLIRKADAICGSATTRVDGLTEPGDSATVADSVAYVKQTLAIIEPTLAQLGGLAAAPTDFVVLERNLIAPSKAQVTAAHTFISEVEQASGDATGEGAAVEKFVGASADPDEAAHDKALADFGFGACSKTNTGAAPPPTTTTTTQPPPPFLARDSSFSAVFPVSPTRTTLPITIGGRNLQAIFYRAVTTTEDISVAYIPLPTTPTAAGIQTTLNDSVERGAAAVSGTVTSKSRITYLGAPAEDGVITAPGHIVHIRVVIIARRSYVLQGITYDAATPHPQYDELLATFHSI